ncbi:tigger transposable element-derived protein, putative, partial [Rhizoctonia solani AG-3 Rhs1AP]
MPASRAVDSRPISAVAAAKPPVKRHRLTLQDRLDVIKFCEENPHLTDGEAAWLLRRKGYLTLSQSSVWRLKKDKDNLRALAQNPNELRFKRIRQVEFPDIDQALQKWILQSQGRRSIRLTGDLIRGKAQCFAKLFGHPDNFLALSGGWLSSLKARMGLRQYRFHGEAASAPIGTLGAEIQRVRSITQEYQP